jgi:hypothetical protein
LVDAMLNEENLEGRMLFELNKFDKPVTLDSLSEKIDVAADEIKEMIADGQISGLEFLHLDGRGYLVSDLMRNQLAAKVLDILAEWHKNNPLFAEGYELKEISGKTGLATAFGMQFLQNQLARMMDEGQLKSVGATWALANHKVKIDPRTNEQLSWLEYKIEGFGMNRPTLKELEAMANQEKINKGKLMMLLTYLAHEGKIYFNGEDFIDMPMLNSIRTKLLRELSEKPRGINEKEFRELINGTKKMIQVLINIFTAEGVIEKEKFYLFITENGRSVLGME